MVCAYLIDLVVAELVTVWNVLAAHSVVHISLDTTWRNAVDSDLLVTTVDSHASDESLNGTLGSGVDSVLWHTLGLTSDGTHEDNATTNAQVLVCLAGNEELATGVDAEHTVELLLGDVLQVSERDNARVGADNVELAVVLNSLVHELGGLRDITDISLESDSVAAVLLDLVDNLVGRFGGVGVVDDDLCTAAGELCCHGGTDATAGASDEGDLAIQAGGLDRLGCRHCCG